jgi:hypothetical protein
MGLWRKRRKNHERRRDTGQNWSPRELLLLPRATVGAASRQGICN